MKIPDSPKIESQSWYCHLPWLLHLCRVPKFLVIQTAFIGDVVLATCILEKLHQAFPEDSIDLLLRKGNEALFEGHPFIHEILIWDKSRNKQLNLLRVMGAVRKRKYDKVINVQRFAATGLITAFSGARETFGFDKNPFSFLFSTIVKHLVDSGGAGIHETARDLSLIRQFTDDREVKPRLYPTITDHQRVEPYKSRPYITISPASVWLTKQYPPDKWISFIKGIPKGFQVYLLGGPADLAICEKIANSSASSQTSILSGKLSFLQSAALMKDAVMNYVNDSAPMHFASAVNAPVTAVYCSTIPAFGFWPLSDVQFIVQTSTKLDCRPCGLHGFKACPRGHFDCGFGIADEQLLLSLPRE